MVDPFSSKHNVIGKTGPLLAWDIFFIAEICQIGQSINTNKTLNMIESVIFLNMYLKSDSKTN